jgi:multiple sugar transport system permease protein
MIPTGLRPRGSDRFWALALLSPTLLGLLLGALGSVVATAGLSLLHWDLLTPPSWAGLDNYTGLAADRGFLRALGNTLAFSALYVPLTVGISLAVALLLNRKMAGVGLFRALYFLPVITSPTAVGLIWSWIFAQDQGLLNGIVTALGGDPVRWLGPRMVLVSVVIVNVWGAIGEGMIVFLAGLQAVPRDYYEAARIDGARPRHQLVFITLPLLVPSLFFQAVLSTIHAFQAFDYIYILTRTANGGSTLPTVIYSIYRTGFGFFRMGDAAAQSLTLAAMILVLTLGYFRLQKRWGAH